MTVNTTLTSFTVRRMIVVVSSGDGSACGGAELGGAVVCGDSFWVRLLEDELGGDGSDGCADAFGTGAVALGAGCDLGCCAAWEGAFGSSGCPAFCATSAVRSRELPSTEKITPREFIEIFIIAGSRLAGQMRVTRFRNSFNSCGRGRENDIAAPVRGCSSSRSAACRKFRARVVRVSFLPCNSLGAPYRLSPTTGCPRAERWTRIWCVRPV